MQTIFSGNRKSVRKPEFVEVTAKDELPNYRVFSIRAAHVLNTSQPTLFIASMSTPRAGPVLLEATDEHEND